MRKATLISIACLTFSGLFSQNLTSGEYWIDMDPGFGQATSFAFPAIDDVSGQVENLDLSGEEPGPHRIGLRAKDDNGAWGHTQCRTLLIEQGASGDIASIEYFWDTDNGFGSGTSVAPGLGNDLPSYLLPANVISTAGEHYLYMRSRDERGSWGHTHMDTVQIMPVGISELEQLGIRVYPNPFEGPLYIEPSNKADFLVDLRDMRGRSLFSKRITGRSTVEIEGLAAGMYQVLIILPSGTIYSTHVTKQ